MSNLFGQDFNAVQGIPPAVDPELGGVPSQTIDLPPIPQLPQPVQQGADAAAGLAEGDPAPAAALFTEGFQKLGEAIGGDLGAAIEQLAPGLGEASADLATMVIGGADGNDEAVANAEARLTALEGDGLSSLGHWVEEKLKGEDLGAGIASATDAVDKATQTVAAVDKFVVDFQKGDGLDAMKDLSGALHGAGVALNDAGHAIQELGKATGIDVIEGVAGAASDVFGQAGEDLNALGDVTDKATAGVSEIIGAAEAPAQLVAVLTDDGAKAAVQLGKDAWHGVTTVGNDQGRARLGRNLCLGLVW